MRRRQVYNICFLLMVKNVISTDDIVGHDVDSYGDQRGGQGNNFYDLVYDDSVCPTALKATAVSGYIFVGGIILKSLPITSASECLIECYKNKRCKSVNVYYEYRPSKEYHLCELNVGSQIDDPRAMIIRDNAAYYENVECPINFQLKSKQCQMNSPTRLLYDTSADNNGVRVEHVE